MDPKKMPDILIPNADVIKCSDDLIDEFTYVLKAVYFDTLLRLKTNLLANLKLSDSVLKRSKEVYLSVYHDIEQRYKNEIRSIELACSVLSKAVDAECQIRPQMMLIGDEFLIEPDVPLFEDMLIIPDGLVLKFDPNFIYSIQQLQNMFDLLKKYSPNFLIPEKAFIYILQDLVIQNPEDVSPELLLPSPWKRLTFPQISKLIHNLFGHEKTIDWREYLLYNISIEFPNINEILAMRHFFREIDSEDTELIYENQYQSLTMWFELSEYDTGQLLYRKLLKKLLWNCFKIDDERMNYVALMLALCKDEISTMGVAKALTLSLGKEVCTNYELGERYIAAELKKRRRLVWEATLKQIDHEDAVLMSQEVIDQMTETVLDECDEDRLILEEIKSKSKTDMNKLSQSKIPLENDKEISIESPEYPNNDDVIIENNSVQDKSSQSVSEETFSNVEIGFEPFEFPNLVYILSLDSLINVLTVALPRNFSTIENIVFLYDSLKIPDLDNNVCVHRFLNNPEFAELIKGTTKFSTKNAAHIVFDLLKESWQ